MPDLSTADAVRAATWQVVHNLYMAGHLDTAGYAAAQLELAPFRKEWREALAASQANAVAEAQARITAHATAA